MATLLTWPWWQGVAGLAQIFAAILTVISVLLAILSLMKAENMRRESLEPEWDFVNNIPLGVGPTARNPEWSETILRFLNSGFGPAKNLQFEFDSYNGNMPTALGQYSPSSNVIGPNEVLTVQLGWRFDSPLMGFLIISCKTRTGILRRKFEVATLNNEASIIIL